MKARGWGLIPPPLAKMPIIQLKGTLEKEKL